MQRTWDIYQQNIAAYRNPNRVQAKQDLAAVIWSISLGVPAELPEVRTLVLQSHL